MSTIPTAAPRVPTEPGTSDSLIPKPSGAGYFVATLPGHDPTVHLIRQIACGNAGGVAQEVIELRQEVGTQTALLCNRIQALIDDISHLPAEIKDPLSVLINLSPASAGSLIEERTLIAAHRSLRALGAISPEPGVDALKEALREIVTLHATLKGTTDTANLSADGLSRDRIFILHPETLQARRAAQGLSPDEAQVVIVGGGPAGLRSALELGARGMDACLFEAGYFGQAFSDGRAFAVHSMRTNATASSLARVDTSPEGGPVPMPTMHEFLNRCSVRADAAFARTLIEHDGSLGFFDRFPTADSSSLINSLPVPRAELFAYLSWLAVQASAYPTLSLCEQSPVERITRSKDEWFEISTLDGKHIRARHLVIACGFVGTHVDYARSVPDLFDLCQTKSDSMILLGNEHDIAKYNSVIAENLCAREAGRVPPRQMVFSEALLGQPEIQAEIRGVPAGQQIAVVGSGESAVKAVLEVLRQNPDARVLLFSKGKLEPSQFQFPVPRVEGDFALRAALDPHFASEMRGYHRHGFRGTPITPHTMMQVLEQVASGRVKVFELGDYFSESVLDLIPQREGLRIQLDPRSQGGRHALEGQDAEWRSIGLLSEPLIEPGSNYLGTIHGPIVVAAGYDATARRIHHPLLRQLSELGLLDESGKSNNPNLHLIGAGTGDSPVNTALAGIGLQATLCADGIRASYLEAGTSSTLARLKNELPTVAAISGPSLSPRVDGGSPAEVLVAKRGAELLETLRYEFDKRQWVQSPHVSSSAGLSEAAPLRVPFHRALLGRLGSLLDRAINSAK